MNILVAAKHPVELENIRSLDNEETARKAYTRVYERDVFVFAKWNSIRIYATRLALLLKVKYTRLIRAVRGSEENRKN